jgi:hypothetical protein
MRELTLHKFTSANEAIKIEVVDKPGHGGASHHYSITGFNTENNPANESPSGYRSIYMRLPVIFQNGTLPEVGVNGVTEQALLAILIDRLQGFQKGPFACRESALALTKLEEAMHWMHARTRERTERGVEGKHEA